MKARVLASITSGHMGPGMWARLLAEEPPTAYGKPSACDDCPLRIGGEWEAGLKEAIAAGLGRDSLHRFGCHKTDKQCAGALRLAGRDNNDNDCEAP